MVKSKKKKYDVDEEENYINPEEENNYQQQYNQQQYQFNQLQHPYNYNDDDQFSKKIKKQYYVKGSDLIKEIRKYQESKKADAKKRNVPLDQANGVISEELGDMIIKICTKFSMHPRFYGYSFREEFVEDAVARCITHAVNKINLDLPNCNVFAYFTQCAYNVFRQKIKSQKKYNQTKQKLRQEVFTEFQNQEGLQQTKDNQQEL